MSRYIKILVGRYSINNVIPLRIVLACLIVFGTDFYFLHEYESLVRMNLTRKVKFLRWSMRLSIVIRMMNPAFPSLPSAADKSLFDDLISCPLMKIEDEWQLY